MIDGPNSQAGTGCGGCEPMVKDIFTFAMKNSGKEVSTDVCEHFKHTRQELYDIVRVRRKHTPHGGRED